MSFNYTSNLLFRPQGVVDGRLQRQVYVESIRTIECLGCPNTTDAGRVVLLRDLLVVGQQVVELVASLNLSPTFALEEADEVGTS